MITWTKEWQGIDDGTILRALDLRNIQQDLANVLQSSDIGSTVQAYNANLQALNTTRNVNSANLIINGAFDVWTDTTPNNWTIGGGGTSAQESTIVQIGQYSLKVTSDSDGSIATQSVIATIGSSQNSYYRGKTLTLTALVYSSAATNARIRIDDGIGISSSSYHSGTPGWEELSVTRTLDAAATKVDVILTIEGVSIPAYFSGITLNHGSIKHAFIRHRNDVTNP